MNTPLRRTLNHLGSALIAAFFLASVGSSAGCGDDFESRVVCRDYCNKRASCRNQSQTAAETQTCVESCRKSIEDDCGNNHQAAANDQISQCTDRSCAEFETCLVFEAAPECVGFARP